MPDTETEWVNVHVTGLTIDPFTNMPIVILKNESQTIALPIWIGLIEASSIATEIENIQFSRPMTHDLFHSALQSFDVAVTKIEIYDIIDNTFYARIFLTQQGHTATLDARPSDAIALALRAKSPIYVDRKVLNKARDVDMAKRYDETSSEEQTWAEILENLSPEDFGKYKM